MNREERCSKTFQDGNGLHVIRRGKVWACNDWLEKRDARKPSRMDMGVQKAKKKLNVKSFVVIKKGIHLYEAAKPIYSA